MRGAVLLTGGTGFLGKVVLHELLRRRDELGIERIHLLVRAPSAEWAQRRVDAEIVGSPCLADLPAGSREALRAIPGDLVEPGCGVPEPLAAELAAEVGRVIHCAASIDFDLPLPEAARVNAGGALGALALARRCAGLRAFVHVSTAYATPHPGDGRALPEELAQLPFEPEALYRDVLAGRVREQEALAASGHPNTYTFTKALAEQLLALRAGGIPLAIVRPSIISACRRHPFPGWIDSQAAFAAFVALLGTGQLRAVAADPRARVDLVPCDEVARRCVDAAFGDPPAGPAPSVRHAVAGLAKSPTVGLCRREILRHFEGRRVGHGPRLRHVGPRGPRFAAASLLHQRLPAELAVLGSRLRGRRRGADAARGLSRRAAELERAFAYFTHRSFDFRASRPLDAGFEPAAYLAEICRGVQRHLLRLDPAEAGFAGRRYRGPERRALWLAGRRGTPAGARLDAVLAARLLARCVQRASCDLEALGAARAALPAGRPLLLVASQRSALDIPLLRLLFAARPELGIPPPGGLLEAAREPLALPPPFSRGLRRVHLEPGVGGEGREDKEATRRVHALVRSRDPILCLSEGAPGAERLARPSPGLLRALRTTGQRFAVLPVVICADRRVEEALAALQGREGAGGSRWLAGALRGELDLGLVHVTCAAPLTLDLGSDVERLADAIAARFRAAPCTTTHHLRAFLARQPIDGADGRWLRDRVAARGGRVLESRLRGEAALPEAVERDLRRSWEHLFTAHGAGAADAVSDPRLAALLRALAEPAA